MSESIEEIYAVGPRNVPGPIPRSATIQLSVKWIDNNLRFWVNGELVYERDDSGQGELNDIVNLSPHLNVGDNELRSVLKNGYHPLPNPWRVHYEILVNNSVVLSVQAQSQRDGEGANYPVFSKKHELEISNRD